MFDEKKLFDVLVGYYNQQISTTESIKDTLADAKDSADKEDVAAINEAAKLYATNKFYDKKSKFEKVAAAYNDLSGDD